MKIELIIQRTHNGLETEYQSTPNANFEQFLLDERKDSLQVSNRKDYYSLSANKNGKVYSLIKSVRDREKRDGFLAVRLLTSATTTINNPTEILKNIAERSENYFQTKDRKQDYSEILSLAQTTQQPTRFTISPSLQKDIYFAEADNEAEIDTVLNSDNAIAAKRLYVFTKDSGFDAAIAQSHFKFKPYSTLNAMKQIEINDSYRLLEYLKINDNRLSTGSGKIIVDTSDIITYKRIDERKERTYNNRFDLMPKEQPIKDDSKKSIMPLVALGLGGLLLGGVGGFFLRPFLQEDKKETAEFLEPIVSNANTSAALFKIDHDTKNPVFIVDSSDASNLQGKKIKYDTGKHEWLYQENQGGDFKEMDRKKFKELLGASADSTAYITALEQISGQHLSEKQSVAKTNTEKINEPTEGSQTAKKSAEHSENVTRANTASTKKVEEKSKRQEMNPKTSVQKQKSPVTKSSSNEKQQATGDDFNKSVNPFQKK